MLSRVFRLPQRLVKRLLIPSTYNKRRPTRAHRGNRFRCTPHLRVAGSGALAWYIWAALGVGAVVLLLAALEIRAVILRRKRRAARLARKKAREAARAAQEEEG